MEDLVPLVTMHGQLDQPALADLMRRCAVCVLPSFYEGVPLVLVEAAACGCRLVSTDLDAFTWASVFRRTESIWRELVG